MTDYKQLCAELLQYWDAAGTPSDFIDTNGYGTIQRIRAALAKPESSGDMADSNHPITPPPELVKQWVSLACEYEGNETWIDLATQAARWGADQELDACCEWAAQFNYDDYRYQDELRTVRRPRPLNLRELALASVKRLEESGEFFSDQMRELEFIRKALEQFND